MPMRDIISMARATHLTRARAFFTSSGARPKLLPGVGLSAEAGRRNTVGCELVMSGSGSGGFLQAPTNTRVRPGSRSPGRRGSCVRRRQHGMDRYRKCPSGLAMFRRYGLSIRFLPKSTVGWRLHHSLHSDDNFSSSVSFFKIPDSFSNLT